MRPGGGAARAFSTNARGRGNSAWEIARYLAPEAAKQINLAAKDAKNAKEKQSNLHRAALQMRTQHSSSISLPAVAISIHPAAECETTPILAGIAFGSRLAIESGS